MNESTTIRWDMDADGVVLLTLDDPNQSANTMNAAYERSMAAVLDRLELELEDVAGVIITSAKRTFFAGGDLDALKRATRERSHEIAAYARAIKGQLRRLETLGRPVVAAINGSALGGGLELCLACHHRVCIDDPAIELGFPEVQLGLLPGGGGVARTVRLVGVLDALTKLLLQGQRVAPAGARELGIVDELVASPEELVAAAKRWLSESPHAVQPWDRDGYEMPGGTPSDPRLAQSLPALPAKLRKQLRGANYPAPHHIMAAAVEGAQVDFDSALEIEGRYFVDLVTGQVAKNMIQAFFFDTRRVRGARGRPDGIAAFRPRKAVVLGAGMMGAGIAYVCAEAGIEVILKDVTIESAKKGKQYSEALLRSAVAKERVTSEAADRMLARITATSDPAYADGADFVIEAVFEDAAVKQHAFAEIEPYLAPDALLGSNTSTLPITGLAAAVSRPGDFVGLHFFSPVDKMPLLEVIKGEATSQEALYRALDLARQIKKTPIVVNDNPGFFTSRVFVSFINEGLAMLLEGIPAQTIEQASAQAGYPAPVLQLADELNLNTIRKVMDATAGALDADEDPLSVHPAYGVIGWMLDECNRGGRLAGAGFYDYLDGNRTGLWPGLRGTWPAIEDPLTIPLDDLKERMLFIEAIEAVKCVDEGVIESVADANIGSILGIGYPGWTGGVLQYVSGYAGGVAGFVVRARELAARYGPRFEPPASLREGADNRRSVEMLLAPSGR